MCSQETEPADRYAFLLAVVLGEQASRFPFRVTQRIELRFRWRCRRIRSAARERGARFGETLGVARGSVILMSLRSSGGLLQ